MSRMIDGSGQRPGSTRDREIGTNGPRHVAAQAPAGDMRHAGEPQAARREIIAQAQHARRVDPRRLKQHGPEALLGRSGLTGVQRTRGRAAQESGDNLHVRRLQGQRAALQHRAHQREPVRVQPGCAEAEDRITGARTRAVQQVAPLDDPDAEPGQVEGVVVHQARMLRRLPADERAARFAAAVGDAADQFGDSLRVEPARRQRSRGRTAAARRGRQTSSAHIATRSMPIVSSRPMRRAISVLVPTPSVALTSTGSSYPAGSASAAPNPPRPPSRSRRRRRRRRSARGAARPRGRRRRRRRPRRVRRRLRPGTASSAMAAERLRLEHELARPGVVRDRHRVVADRNRRSRSGRAAGRSRAARRRSRGRRASRRRRTRGRPRRPCARRSARSRSACRCRRSRGGRSAGR